MCCVMDGERSAYALPEDNDTVCIDILARKQAAHRRIDVELHARQRGRSFRYTVASVIERKHIETLGRHPRDAAKMRADVLGVAVQEQHRSFCLSPYLILGRKEPRIERCAIRRLQCFHLVSDTMPLRRIDQ